MPRPCNWAWAGPRCARAGAAQRHLARVPSSPNGATVVEAVPAFRGRRSSVVRSPHRAFCTGRARVDATRSLLHLHTGVAGNAAVGRREWRAKHSRESQRPLERFSRRVRLRVRAPLRRAFSGTTRRRRWWNG
jgi:hypothetical protein